MSRYLTTALLAIALLPACKDPDAEDRIAKLEATVEAQAGLIADLQAQLGKQPDSTGMMVASLEQRVASLESSLAQAQQRLDGVTTPKVPHLIGDPGTAGEVDYGPYYDRNHYWSDAVGGYVQFDGITFCYENLDCTGRKAIVPSTDGTVFFNGPNGVVIESGAQVTDFVCQSAMRNGHCDIYNVSGVEPIDTAVPAKQKLATMSVLIR